MTGGKIEEEPSCFAKNSMNILVTGHEDGTIKFWDCTRMNLTPLLQIRTSSIFG